MVNFIDTIAGNHFSFPDFLNFVEREGSGMNVGESLDRIARTAKKENTYGLAITLYSSPNYYKGFLKGTLYRYGANPEVLGEVRNVNGKLEFCINV